MEDYVSVYEMIGIAIWVSLTMNIGGSLIWFLLHRESFMELMGEFVGGSLGWNGEEEHQKAVQVFKFSWIFTLANILLSAVAVYFLQFN